MPRLALRSVEPETGQATLLLQRHASDGAVWDGAALVAPASRRQLHRCQQNAGGTPALRERRAPSGTGEIGLVALSRSAVVVSFSFSLDRIPCLVSGERPGSTRWRWPSPQRCLS